MSEQRTETMWGGPDDERLVHFGRDEYIEDFIDQCHPDAPPDTFEVVKYERATIPESYLKGRLLDLALEMLDEEFGDPDTYSSEEATEAMKAAEETFIKVILADFPVWRCEPTTFEIVNAREWLRKHKPDWHEEIYGPTPPRR